MRRPVLATLFVAAVTACGGSGKHATTPTAVLAKPATFAGTVTRTVAPRTAFFKQETEVTLGAQSLDAAEQGTISFVERKARIFKQLTSGGVPGEIVVIGPITYANSNAQAALADPSVRPWTKLDTRKLTAREAATQADEYAHAITPAYLAAGVAKPRLVGYFGALTEFRGRVDIALLKRRVPASVRPWVERSLAADYPAGGFEAQFWLGPQGRVRRVIVTYKTAKGTPVGIATEYSAFGTGVNLTLPPADEIKDVTPTR